VRRLEIGRGGYEREEADNFGERHEWKITVRAQCRKGGHLAAERRERRIHFVFPADSVTSGQIFTPSGTVNSEFAAFPLVQSKTSTKLSLQPFGRSDNLGTLILNSSVQ